jgi:hypothetical protein
MLYFENGMVAPIDMFGRQRARAAIRMAWDAVKGCRIRLDWVHRFKFTQEVAGADKVDAVVDDHPPMISLASNRSSASDIGAENSVSSAAASPSPRVAGTDDPPQWRTRPSEHRCVAERTLGSRFGECEGWVACRTRGLTMFFKQIAANRLNAP